MNDPYKVLNIKSTATDTEVKQAYRELARKYHPDNYAENPLSDLAEEKMKEINEAYDDIMRRRGGGNSGSSADSGGWRQQSYGNAGGSGVYNRIRQYIMANNLDQAEQMLGSVPDKNAEWFFLSGAIAQRRGWYDEALRNYQTAYSMEPGNMEYRQAVSMMEGGGRAYRAPTGFGGGRSMDLCTSLICADCLCECCGGNLIPCIGCR